MRFSHRCRAHTDARGQRQHLRLRSSRPTRLDRERRIDTTRCGYCWSLAPVTIIISQLRSDKLEQSGVNLVSTSRQEHRCAVLNGLANCCDNRGISAIIGNLQRHSIDVRAALERLCKNASFSQRFLYLSRAWVGKMIILASINGRKKISAPMRLICRIGEPNFINIPACSSIHSFTFAFGSSLCKTRLSFLSFPYVCPEPVLVKY